MKPLIAVVGPTATGKTEVSIRLAQKTGGEIVNADSRQVYRYMDIGTAKPTQEEHSLVPHHLFDVVDPDDDFSLALYQDMAISAIGNIHYRGKTPILTGGSGQYVWAVLEGWSVPEVAPDEQLRRELERKAAEQGGEALFEELKKVDPQAAEQIDPRNIRRIIRALEVCRATGKKFSELRTKHPPDFDVRILGLTVERDELYRRIDARVDAMMERGFVDEVRGLIDRGYSLDLSAMSSLGYREVGRHLKGETSLEEAVRQIKFATHRFARQQYAWFKLSDSRIRWFDISRTSAGKIISSLADDIGERAKQRGEK
ncbi:MAG: tRNA (adenosine(37)-N6)-dimethylallyltransferase MiaA [Dehalococcoidia bacterium]